MPKPRPPQDFPRSQGGAAIGALLRRLSDRVDREADAVYRELGVDFQQRWYGVINQLTLHDACSVGELAETLGVSHVAVSQVRAALEARGLVSVRPEPSDGRKRLLRLSAAGKRLVARLSPTWDALNLAARNLDTESGGAAQALLRLEAALGAKSLIERVRAKL